MWAACPSTPSSPRRRDVPDLYLWSVPSDPDPDDIRLRDPTTTGSFPTQFAGFRVRKSSGTIELCLVATADAPAGMGGQLRLRRSADTLAFYLVDTTDPNASPLRIQTSTGVKSVRLKT